MGVELSPAAERDLGRIYDFNMHRSWQWTDKVQRRLSERMRRLLIEPDIGRPVPGQSIRRLSVTDIQYVIDYERFEDGVRILRIRHAREMR